MSGAFHPPASRPLRRWLHADERGSVVAESDASGAAVATYAYGPWGELDTTAGGRFRYTGQALIPELGLYYYKARMYSAYLGRFLQTDPAGYADGLNLYAYAGGDPINATDPSGLAASAVDDTAYIEAIIVVGNKLKREPLFVGLTITGGSLFNFGGSGGDAGGSSSGKDKPAKEKPQSKQCAGPPAAPGTGATSSELTNQARTNAAQAASRMWDPTNLFWFRSQVRNGGPWDYKQFNRGFEDFGNYNYGYTGAAMGVAPDFLLQQAGRAQQAAGTSQPDWGSPGPLGLFGGTPPYGDDPHDQDMIKRGIADRRNGC